MYRLIIALFSLCSSAVVLSACDSGAPPSAAAPVLKIAERVQVQAPADKVWRISGDFDALPRWLPTIAKTELIRGQNNKPGAVRLLTLKEGGTVEQELLAYDAAAMSYRYRIIRGVLPVSDYESTINVEPAGNGKSKAIWSANFKRMDTKGKPAPGAGDKAAMHAVRSHYEAGLDNLKKIAEGARGIAPARATP
jgi:mxaD protein